MFCIPCVLFSFCAVPLNNTAPCHKKEVNGFVYIVIIELKTHTLVEVAEELLMGLKGVGGWVLLLYPEYASNTFQ